MLALDRVVPPVKVGGQARGIDRHFNVRLSRIGLVDVELHVGLTEMAVHEAQAEVTDDEPDPGMGRVIQPRHRRYLAAVSTGVWELRKSLIRANAASRRPSSFQSGMNSAPGASLAISSAISYGCD